MASSLMVHNGKGWRRAGTCTRAANEGHAANSLGFYAGPYGYRTLEVGEQLWASTKDAKSAINKGLNAAGWLSDTLHGVREHPTGAIIEVAFNVPDESGRMWKAVYTRTS